MKRKKKVRRSQPRKPRAKKARVSHRSASKKKLKISYKRTKLFKKRSRAAKVGWVRRRQNIEAGIHTKPVSQRKVKKTSKVHTYKSASRGGKKIEINKRMVQFARSIEVDELNAIPELEYHLFEPALDAYDSLKKSKKRLNLFNLSIIFKGKAGNQSVVGELYSIGNAEIQNKTQFRTYFRQVISRFAEKLTTYSGRGLTLFIVGAVLDGISKIKSNPKTTKKPKAIRRGRP